MTQSEGLQNIRLCRPAVPPKDSVPGEASGMQLAVTCVSTSCLRGQGGGERQASTLTSCSRERQDSPSILHGSVVLFSLNKYLKLTWRMHFSL